MEPDRRSLRAALFLSTVAAAFSAYAAFRPTPPAPAPSDPASLRAEITEVRKALDGKADTAQLAASIQRLHARLDLLEARLGQAPAAPTPKPAVATDDEPDDPAGPGASPPAAVPAGAFNGPRFVELQPPATGLSVKQLPDGTLSVLNTDPALTGRTLLVRGTAEDGTERDIPITVPPP